MLFLGDIYPNAAIDITAIPVQDYFEVTEEIAYNPMLVAAKAMKGLANADALWAINQIRNPFEELKPGTILAIPLLSSINEATARKQSQQRRTIRLKNGRVDGNKAIL